MFSARGVWVCSMLLITILLIYHIGCSKSPEMAMRTAYELDFGTRFASRFLAFMRDPKIHVFASLPKCPAEGPKHSSECIKALLRGVTSLTDVQPLPWRISFIGEDTSYSKVSEPPRGLLLQSMDFVQSIDRDIQGRIILQCLLQHIQTSTADVAVLYDPLTEPNFDSLGMHIQAYGGIVSDWVLIKGRWNASTGALASIDFWAWNISPVTLYEGSSAPLRFGSLWDSNREMHSKRERDLSFLFRIVSSAYRYVFDVGKGCEIKKKGPHICTCSTSPLLSKIETSAFEWNCEDPMVSKEFRPSHDQLMSHSITNLLPLKSGPENTIVLTAATIKYKDSLMSFICNLRRLNIHHVVVAALDEDLYHFGIERGLPVFRDDDFPDVEADDCDDGFGGTCFSKVTKLKSRAALKILRMGYNVLWSDCDIIWFKDPTLELLHYGPRTLPIQSNEPSADYAANGYRRINSGFYLARSEPETIAAFTAIVQHAKKSKLTEQPSFWDILCSGRENPQFNDDCVWKDRLKVVVLDRWLYPNGKIFGIWNSSDIVHDYPDLRILHNNWIHGQPAKIARAKSRNLWFFDENNGICLYS